MKRPTVSEFDGWRQSVVGIWFFEHYLQGYADFSAGQNGRAVGLYSTSHEELMTYARNAGVIQGVEYAIGTDPFEEERSTDENQSS